MIAPGYRLSRTSVCPLQGIPARCQEDFDIGAVTRASTNPASAASSPASKEAKEAVPFSLDGSRAGPAPPDPTMSSRKSPPRSPAFLSHTSRARSIPVSRPALFRLSRAPNMTTRASAGAAPEAKALRTISGPTPPGSPRVTPIAGRVIFWVRRPGFRRARRVSRWSECCACRSADSGRYPC